MYYNFFEQNPKKTITIILIIIIFALALSFEYFLRTIGYMPECNYYQTVDKLIIQNQFYTDHLGIFKANPNYKWGEGENVNKEGFRSPDFKKPLKNQKSILLLGDSFAWGVNAKPLTNCFADLLRNEGYEVYNTGIPGVGPTQYESIAKIYIPLLKPDYVIVAFFLGNDLLEKPHPMIPNHNLFHVTNAGWIDGFDEKGTPLSAEDAYKYYISTNKIKNKYLLKTSLGTLMFYSERNFRQRIQEIKHLLFFKNKTNGAHKYKYTFDCLNAIKQLSITSKSQFNLLIIPDLGKNRGKKTGEEFRQIFDSLDPIYLKDIKQQMFYAAPDGHLNNKGHLYVKDIIINVLKTKSEGKDN